MSSCCATPNGQAVQTTEHRTQQCPVCGKKGKAVDSETVKALLAVTLHEIRPDSHYLFCRAAECPVVYFADNGEQTFTERKLRERVHQKHPDAEDVFVCYCFRHTPGSIREEVLEIGRSTAVATITAGIQEGQCACEIRNPQGSCCLGNVRAVVERVTASVESLNKNSN